ncbi:MAG: hypothetical protein HDS92_04485 [Bacteroidales bacterium]|nr:hypothetical protein [Bacteroidales bacterium]
MATFTGKPVEIQRPQNEVYQKLANLGDYQTYMDQLPEEIRAKIGDVRFTPDAILITAAPVGEITLAVTDRRESQGMTFTAANSPVPMTVDINLTPAGESPDATILAPSITVEVPAMLRPLVAPKMEEAANRLGEMLGNFFNLSK